MVKLKMITGIQDITITVKLTTRCGSRGFCDNLPPFTCEECLEREIRKKLRDNGTLPRFKIQDITLEAKPITCPTNQDWLTTGPPPPQVITVPPPQVTVEYGSSEKQGRPLSADGAVTVFFFHEGNKAWGPYYKLRTKRVSQGTAAGHPVTREEAEALVPREVLEAKFQRAKTSLLRKHPDIVLKLSKALER